MFKSLDRNLNKLYKFSGYVAAIFLIFVAVFILIGISSRIFGFYIRGLAEYSGYCMAAASFFALAYTFVEGGHIRITLFLEKLSGLKKKIIETWCLSIASFFSGYLAFYFIKMLIISLPPISLFGYVHIIFKLAIFKLLKALSIDSNSFEILSFSIGIGC